MLEASGRDSDKASFTEAKRVLYHRCMRIILEHLDDATQRQIFLAYLLLLLFSLTIIKKISNLHLEDASGKGLMEMFEIATQ
jgi:hypothetical protein